MKKVCFLLILGSVVSFSLSAHGRPKCSNCDNSDKDSQATQAIIFNVFSVFAHAVQAASNHNKPNVVAQNVQGILTGIGNIVQEATRLVDLTQVNKDEVAKIVAEKLLAMKADSQLGDWARKRGSQNAFIRATK